MAKSGLNNFWISELTAESSAGVPTYGTPEQPGKAVEFSCEPEYNDASLYADDGLAESDKGFKSATVNMTVDKEDIATKAKILGHSTAQTTGELIYNANDIAPYLGVGRVLTMIENGSKKYLAKVLHKVKFSEPSESETTHGESTEFGTTQYPGVAMALADGKWKSEKTFTSKDDAINFVKTTLGYTAPSQNGGTGN